MLDKSIFPQLLNLRHHHVSGLLEAYFSANDLTAVGLLLVFR